MKGFEEQQALNNAKRIAEDIKQKFAINKEPTISHEEDAPTNEGDSLFNNFVRVRTNTGTGMVNKTNTSNENPTNNSFYNPNFDSTNNKAAFVEALAVIEIFTLIFLVSLVTYVVLKGIS